MHGQREKSKHQKNEVVHENGGQKEEQHGKENGANEELLIVVGVGVHSIAQLIVLFAAKQPPKGANAGHLQAVQLTAVAVEAVYVNGHQREDV